MRKVCIGIIAWMMASTAASAQSPNERVHVLQKRDYSVKNKIEISLFAGASVDDIFTQHFSGTLAVDYHIDEAFALEAMWMSCKVPFVSDSWARFGHDYSASYDNIKNAMLAPSNADLAMISNYLGLNVQFSPLYGKSSLFNMGLGHADFYLTAGGGIVTTEFRDNLDKNSWFDTGNYFMGNFGLGFRVFMTRWFALRLDVRDFTFAAKVPKDLKQPATGDETKIRNTLFVMLGASFLFGGEAPVEIWSPY